jgi:hypothetical protein
MGKRSDAIRALLARQQVAENKMAKSGQFPPEVIKSVRVAVVMAAQAIGEIHDDIDLDAALARVGEALNKFRTQSRDDDGYGAATFHEIVRDLENAR